MWLSEQEQWVYEETLRMNERGLPVDIPLAKKTIKFIEAYTIKRVEECKHITDGIPPTQVGKLLEWLQNEGLDIHNLQRVTLEKVLSDGGLDPQVEEVIKVRLEMGRVSTKKLYKMLEMDSGDGYIRGSFIYHGAGTGRFTAKRLQPHNFQRPTIEDVDGVIKSLKEGKFTDIIEKYGEKTLEAIGSCMRGFFKAPKGELFVRADYNAIEARVLAWLARENTATMLFHTGEDIYCDMAGSIFGVEPAVIKEGNKKGILKYSDMRKLGKDTILGCGYNMGVITFLCQMESKGADKIAGIPIRKSSEDRGKREKEYFTEGAWRMASDAVYGYRRKYNKIVKLWELFDTGAKRVIVTGKGVRICKLVKLNMEGHSLVMTLPSGRKIYYPYAEVIKRENKWNGKMEDAIRFRTVSERGQWIWEWTYGGKLVENAVQAISRDLLVHGMRNAAKAGFRLIGTVHDEIIALHKWVYGKVRLARIFEKLICKLPSWAIGNSLELTIPLAAEGVVSERYGK